MLGAFRFLLHSGVFPAGSIPGVTRFAMQNWSIRSHLCHLRNDEAGVRGVMYRPRMNPMAEQMVKLLRQVGVGVANGKAAIQLCADEGS